MTTATISDFITTRMEGICPSSSVQGSAKKMTDRDVCSLVVIGDKDSKVLGLITSSSCYPYGFCKIYGQQEGI
jgi:hypothetical protein